MSRPLRHTFILLFVALGTCLAAVSGWRYARASAPVNGPIILISIDSLRADRLPAYGYVQGRTPAIDTLAADGVVFERAYSHVPQTLPAHASLLSGRIPFETGVRDDVGFSVPASERLLPEMLGDRGYATAGIVSSFLLRRETGISQGFDFFDAELSGTGTAPGTEPYRGLRREAPRAEQVAEQWLDAAGTSRAFLFLHLDEWSASAPASPQETSAAYDAAVTRADEAVGRLIRYLKRHQLYDESTVILVSDHGEGLGDHGEQGHGLFVYDNTLRVPFIIKPQAGEGAGRRVTIPVQHVDLVPTVLDLAKAPSPGNLRGRSLTSLLTGSGSVDEQTIYAESLFALYHFDWSALTTLTDGTYRYVSAPREELFNLSKDAGQTTNVAADHPELVASFRRQLLELVPHATMSAGNPAAVSDANRERYAALGLVGLASDPPVPTSEPIDPKDRWAIVEEYRSAAALMGARKWIAAVDQLRKLTRQEPSIRDAWMLLAVAAGRAERHELSVEAFAQAIQLAPERDDAYLGAAAALFRLKKMTDAAQHAQRIVDRDTSDAASRSAAHELLARIALSRHDLESAREEALHAEEADPGRPVRAYIDGRIAFDERRYDDAFAAFEPALPSLEDTPSKPIADLRLYAAETLVKLERWNDAEPLFTGELETNPQSTRARAGLAAVYKATGRTAEHTQQ